LIESNLAQLKIWFKSKLALFSWARPSSLCPQLAHILTHARARHPLLPCSHVADWRLPPPAARLASRQGPHAVLHPRGASEPGPPLLFPPRGAAHTRPLPSPPLFSPSGTLPQRGVDAPTNFSFLRELIQTLLALLHGWLSNLGDRGPFSMTESCRSTVTPPSSVSSATRAFLLQLAHA
jgi:hypothetical protein